MLLFSLITFCIFNCVRCDSESFRFGRTSNREATIHSLSSQYSVSGAALGHNENQAVASQQPHSPDIRLQKLTSLAKSFGGDASKGQQAISLWKSLLSIVLFDENATDKFMWDKSVVNMATKNGVVSLVKVESAVGSLKAKYYLVEDKMDKLNLDALIKRGELFSALKRHSEVIADMDKVIELSSTQYLELFFRRGSAKRSMNDLLGAWADFNISLGLPAAEQSSYGIATHYRGNVEADLGRYNNAISTFKKAIKLGTSISHAYNDISAAYVELGDWKNSLRYLNLTINANNAKGISNKLAISRRGVLYQNLGRHNLAIEDLSTCLAMDSRDTQCLLLLSVCYISVGQFLDSKKAFDKLLAIDSTHYGWARKEAMLFIAQHAHQPLSSFNMDQHLNGAVRFHSSKLVAVPAAAKAEHISYEKRPALTATATATVGGAIDDISRSYKPTEEFNESVKVLFQQTGTYSSWVQLNTSGFLPNQRSHASFGIAVLQMAQKLSVHVSLIRQGRRGVLVPDSGSSHPTYEGVQSCPDDGAEDCPKGYHVFGWRDYFDMYVRWRQLSEPMDTVWWADKFPSKERDQNSQSINTHLLNNGHSRPVRYYPYFKKAFQLMKRLVVNVGYHGSDAPETLKRIAQDKVVDVLSAADLESFKNVVGQPFLVRVPIHSITTGKNISGGDLVVDGTAPNGPDLTIMFGLKPKKSILYQRELHTAFQQLVDTLVAFSPTDNNNNSGESSHDDGTGIQKVLKKALGVFYYWVNLTPLSRGSSACGYGALYAAVLSQGYRIESRVPRMKQLDFEAFFSLTPDQFAGTVASWLTDINPASETLQYWIRGQDFPDKQTSVEISVGGVLSGQGGDSLREPLVVEKLFPNVASIFYVLSRLDEYRPAFFDK